MKKIDLYIIRKFLGTYFFIMLLLITIGVVIDISEKIDDFIKNDAPLNLIITQYYINFIIYYSNLFSSFFVFIAVIFFTGKMAHRLEIIAILSSGVSYNRLLRPFMISATILVALTLYVNHFALPNATITKNKFEEAYVGSGFRIIDQNIHREISPGTIVYFKQINVVTNVGKKFALENWSNGKLNLKIMAERAVLDSTTLDSAIGKWELVNYFMRKYEGNKEIITSGASKTIDLPLKISDFGQRQSVVEEMTTPELNQFIAKQFAKGSDEISFYELEKYQRTSMPFAAYILTLIGVGIAGRKIRGGIGLQILLGIVLTAIYFFSMKMTTVASTNAGLPPVYGVWIPNIIFSFVAVYFYFKAQK